MEYAGGITKLTDVNPAELIEVMASLGGLRERPRSATNSWES